MRKKWSKIAYNIDKEYKQKQAYKKIKRQKCKEKKCVDCRWWRICQESKGDNEC